jgi:putative ABC transport system permease protein
MRNFFQDIRYGIRILLRKPGFTALAVLTLALGIGANTAIFSVVDAVLLRPLPFHEPDKLAQLFETELSPGNFPMTGQDFLDWRAQNRTFQDMAVYSYQESFNVMAPGAAEPERVMAVQTQANFFGMLGVAPLRGRAFLNGEDQIGKNHVVLLSYGFWQTFFAGQISALDSTVKLNGEEYSVIGVMPPWYRVPGGADMWMPIDASAKGLGPRGTHHLRAIGRIKDGVTFAQAQADLKLVADNLAKQFPDSNQGETAVLVPLRKQLIGETGSEIWTLFGAVGMVLLIACVNVANLLLARATSRKREIAVRAALGAARGRLVRQLLTESVLLAIFGAVPGIALAYACVRWLGNSTQLPFPQANLINVNPIVLLFTIGVSVGIGILFGLAPAIQTSQVSLVDVLKAAGGRSGSSGGGSGFLRDALVVTEIALSLALLAGAALLLRTFSNLRAVDIGVPKDRLLTAQVLLPVSSYGSYDKQVAFWTELATKLSATPGIESGAITSEVPLSGGNNGYVKIDGQPDNFSEGQLVEWTYVTPQYLPTVNLSILSGRGLTDQDVAATADGVRKYFAQTDQTKPPAGLEIPVDISRTMARRFWTERDAIGKTFHASGVQMRVVGIVPDVKIFSLRGAPLPQAYVPMPYNVVPMQTFPWTIVARGIGRPEQLAGTLRTVVRSVDPSLAVFSVSTMNDIVAENISGETDETFLLAVFAGLALVLAAVGTYGVMAYVVTQRTGEIGIRMALGAGRERVLWMVLRQGLGLAGLGTVLGIGGAYASSSLLSSILYGVKPNDPATLAVASALMCSVALAACVIPATRAMRVEPVVALRYE